MISNLITCKGPRVTTPKKVFILTGDKGLNLVVAYKMGAFSAKAPSRHMDKK